MRKGKFTEEQMVAIPREADRRPVAAVAKKHGVSEQTIYTWRKRFGAMHGLLEASASAIHLPAPPKASHFVHSMTASCPSSRCS